MESKILIVPIGEIETELLSWLREQLAERFHKSIEIASEIKEIDYAYSSKRAQYHSTAILERVAAIKKDKFEVLLAIADVDLYLPELNFVFGEADITNQVALIALARLRQEFYALAADKNLFLQRALKEAVHEIGHLYGLGHCQSPNCVMYFSNSLMDTDRKSSKFCPDCQGKLN